MDTSLRRLFAGGVGMVIVAMTIGLILLSLDLSKVSEEKAATEAKLATAVASETSELSRAQKLSLENQGLKESLTKETEAQRQVWLFGFYYRVLTQVVANTMPKGTIVTLHNDGKYVGLDDVTLEVREKDLLVVKTPNSLIPILRSLGFPKDIAESVVLAPEHHLGVGPAVVSLSQQ